jgi:hypothetical protein
MAITKLTIEYRLARMAKQPDLRAFDVAFPALTFGQKIGQSIGKMARSLYIE